VQQLRAELQRARIYVFGNNSTDRSAEVFLERRRGEGYVAQSMFREIAADVFVRVDGDRTYAVSSVHCMLSSLLAARPTWSSPRDWTPHRRATSARSTGSATACFLLVIDSIFRVQLSDLLSGFRAFSRQFVKGLPSPSQRSKNAVTKYELRRGERSRQY
jgi:hypothetical protein